MHDTRVRPNENKMSDGPPRPVFDWRQSASLRVEGGISSMQVEGGSHRKLESGAASGWLPDGRLSALRKVEMASPGQMSLSALFQIFAESGALPELRWHVKKRFAGPTALDLDVVCGPFWIRAVRDNGDWKLIPLAGELQ